MLPLKNLARKGLLRHPWRRNDIPSFCGDVISHPYPNRQVDLAKLCKSWWRHQMETFSALLAICAENSPVPGEFPAQRPVTRSFDVFSELRLNKRLSKQSWGWWFETLSCSLWRHRNVKGASSGVLLDESFNKPEGSSPKDPLPCSNYC